MPTALERLGELFAKVDAFFAQAAARHPGPEGITCHAGCSDCCRRRFSVTAIEAEVIAGALPAVPAPTREAMAARAAEEADACPALEPDGRCSVYEVRPLVCRSHGLPIRFASDGRRSLPLVDVCPRNFAGRDTLPADAVLDQTTLSTVLGALDVARADERGRPRGERVDLARLLGGVADRLPAGVANVLR